MLIIQLIKWFQAHKTFVAGLGLLAMSVFDLTTGDYSGCWKELLESLAAFGVHMSLEQLKTEAINKEVHRMMLR